MSDVTLSVILCTRNRGNAIGNCLDSIARSIQAAPEIGAELVVVDNGSTDQTSDVLRRFVETAGVTVRVVEEGRKGLSNARNAGVVAARAELLAFTDDDCVMDANYVRLAAERYRSLPGDIIVGGRVELGDPTDQPFTIKTDLEPDRLTSDKHPGVFLAGCNMIISRGVFSLIGLFDARFGAGARFVAAEETDFVYRAHKRAIPVVYDPDLVVHHFHGRKTTKEIEQLFWGYCVGNGALYAKHIFDRSLLRHFYWDLRKALRGSTPVTQSLELTHRQMVAANMTGMLRYVRSVVGL